MPDELIIDTFKYVHACIFDGPPETFSYEWMRLLNVCTRWCSIIRSVSDLWRIITLTPESTPDELVYSLSLCGDQPLDVRFHYLNLKLVSDSSRLLSTKLSTSNVSLYRSLILTTITLLSAISSHSLCQLFRSFESSRTS